MNTFRSFIAVALTTVSLHHAVALTLPVSEDTYASSAKLTKVAGGATTLTVSSAHAAFMRFEAGAFAGDLPAANVTSARLIIYVPRVTKAGALTLHIVTAEWTEAVSVNTSQPAFDPAPLVTIPLQEVVAKQFIIIDVTVAVKGWLTVPASDFGFAIVGDATANVMLGAKEGPGSGYPATLQIETGGAGVGGLGTLNGADLVGGSVAALALADGAVTGSKLALGSITNAHLAPGFTFPTTSTSIADGSLTAAKIAGGQVVKTLNGLSDAVSLAPGANITLTPSGNTLTISASGAVSNSISHDATLAGAGTVAAPLGIASGAFGAWQTISSDTTALANTNYAVTGGTTGGSAQAVVVTLPAAPAVADIVRVAGVGGGWKLQPNAGQMILGYSSGLALTGGQGVTGAVQYLGGGRWQGMAESQIAAGAITSAQLAGNLTLAGTTSGTFSGNGAALTNLAGGSLGASSVGNAQLADGTVTTSKLADSAVTGAKLAAGAVGSTQIDTSSVQQRVSGSAPGGSFITGINADGSVAYSAPGAGGLTSVSHDATLTGTGTGGSPLGVLAPLTLNSSAEGGGSTLIVNDSGASGLGLLVNGTGNNTSGLGAVGTGPDAIGVDGICDAGIAVAGYSQTGTGVYGSSHSPNITNAGVYGINYMTDGFAIVGNATGHLGVGVIGINDDPDGSGYGVFGRGTLYAAYFQGLVQISGTLSVNGTKNFHIDHPLDPANKTLTHACIESSEVKNLYDGTVTTDEHGDASVTLPAWFEALNRDFRYQLTVVGQFAQAIVGSEIKDNHFTIKTDKPGVKVCWLVTGIRNDAWMQAHPMAVEQDKPAAERGTYLSPLEHGQPEEKSVSWKLHPRPQSMSQSDR